MAELLMPSLGSDMEAGTLVAWRKQLGERVQRGEIVAEVETQKGVIEIECFEDGVLERYLIEPGTQVPVGTPMAVLRTAGDATSAAGAGTAAAAATPTAAPAPAAAPAAPAAPVAPAAPAAPATGPGARVRASPAARRRAAELGVDLTTLRGSGSDGAISLQDIDTAAADRARDLSGDQARKRTLRAAIGAAMARSKREIPHYYLTTTVDLHAATTWLTARNAERGMRERVLPGALLLEAVARAARELPDFNAYFENGAPRLLPNVHLGVAIALRGGGLVAPAIHDADQLSLDALMGKLQDLVTRARSGGLRASELSDGTLTVTALGERGVDGVFPIIYPPQTAIVGFGTIGDRPWVVDGALAVRPVVQASLAADHRVTDGHLGARFLSRIAQLLQSPGEP